MSIPQPPSAPSAPGATGFASATPPKADDRPKGRRRLLADAAGAVALLLALLVVFLLDRNAAGRSAALARRLASTTIFDPLSTPIAEVRLYSKKQWIGGFGGNEASEAAVRLGLDWLARHQADDGHWGPDCLHLAPAGCCRGPEPCPGGGSEHRIAQTGLAILAFQAAGHYDFNGNEYSARVRRGLDWLLVNQRADGRLVDPQQGERSCTLYEHGIAAFALADACEMANSSGEEPADRYRQAAQRAVQFIEYAQHNDGGWRYTDERELASDTSVSGWQVLAMKAAKRAGIVEVGQPCVAAVEAFFKRCEIGASGRTGYMPGQVLSDATTGVGMLVHEFILEQPDSPLVRSGAKYLADVAEHSWKGQVLHQRRFAAHSGDFYTWYNCTLAMFQAGGEPWKRWNDVLRDHLVALQYREPESCANGSWDPDGRWSPQGGRVYSTALAVLTLEVYYRYKSRQAQVYEKP
jgi:hypothetical protein